ncbi:MAG: DsrE family protein, partial [Thiomonas sp.]
MQRTPLFRHARSLALACSLLGAGLAQAQATNPSMLNDFKFDAPTFIHKLPFAKYNLVLQVSEDDPTRWELTLN